ncbi:MAG TPA: nuclear transport factor 2 family protein, partial [Gemmatimonadaceae bacterium]|nr:nuclear transport factor 2 family protein [Gemmatimonadaceae bacterium]
LMAPPRRLLVAAAYAGVALSLHLALAAAARAQGGDASSAAAAIRGARARSNAAIARHDTAGIGAILAPHLVVVSSNSAQSLGRQAMLERFAQQFASRPDVTYRRTPREVRVFSPWGMASESGTWTGSWTDPDGKLAIGGRYFAKWRRIDGRWLVESETYVPEYCRGGTYCVTVP